MSRRVTVAVSLLLALVCTLAGLLGYDMAVAGSAGLPGKTLDDVTAQTISLAALSCPALSGPRLAGQLMANSGFDPGARTADGGSGVAALSPIAFKSWAPWPQASAEDSTASIYALAHYMCDLSGQVRLAKATGDPWKVALAAYHSGLPAVSKAAGIPNGAKSYVDEVDGYATWYAKLPAFGGPQPTSSPSPSAAPAGGPVAGSPIDVPAADLPSVLAAGSTCAQVTPARVAAQLMVSSGFNPNLRAANGAMGIAQFRPDLWSQYAPLSSSPWDPSAATQLMGRTMCDLIRQLAAIGGDSYQIALAAFRVGPIAVRQANGVPNIPALRSFVAQVGAAADFYTSSGKLTAAPSTPASRPTSTSTPTPSSTRPTTASAKPSANASPSRTAPVQYKLVNVLSGKVMAVPNHSKTANDILVQLPDNGDPAEHWQLVDDGYGQFRIKNVFNGLVAAPQKGSTAMLAFITQVPDARTATTEWHLADSGGGIYKIWNSGSNFLLALQYMNNNDGTRLFQTDDNGTADHLWRLVPVG